MAKTCSKCGRFSDLAYYKMWDGLLYCDDCIKSCDQLFKYASQNLVYEEHIPIKLHDQLPSLTSAVFADYALGNLVVVSVVLYFVLCDNNFGYAGVALTGMAIFMRVLMVAVSIWLRSPLIRFAQGPRGVRIADGSVEVLRGKAVIGKFPLYGATWSRFHVSESQTCLILRDAGISWPDPRRVALLGFSSVTADVLLNFFRLVGVREMPSAD